VQSALFVPYSGAAVSIIGSLLWSCSQQYWFPTLEVQSAVLVPYSGGAVSSIGSLL